MQAINLIQQKTGELYCIIDPLMCVQQAQHISYENIYECKYCKSLDVPRNINVKGKKYECAICKCFNQMPEQYFAILPNKIGKILLTTVPNKAPPKSKTQSKQNPLTVPHKSTKPHLASHSPLNTPTKLLFILQQKPIKSFLPGLQCLQQILPEMSNTEVCLISYGTQVKLYELEEDGRVIVINQYSYDIVNDSFYGVAEGTQALGQLLGDDGIEGGLETTVNGSKIVGEIVHKLKCSNLVIFWFSLLNQSLQFYQIPLPHSCQLYPFLMLPHTFSSHSAPNYLQDLNKSCTRVKYLLKTDTPMQHTEKIHYEMYNILQNDTVRNVKIQSSRERKYPPEVLGRKDWVLGSLGQAVIIRLGKGWEDKENGQVRIIYTQMYQQSTQQLIKKQNNQTNQIIQVSQSQKQSSSLLPSKNPPATTTSSQSTATLTRILIITFPLSPPYEPDPFIHRYLHLYKFVRAFPSAYTLNTMKLSELETYDDIDVRQFWKNCSFWQKSEIYAALDRMPVVFAVWPIVGVADQGWDEGLLGEYKGQITSKSKVKFIYHFTGYNITDYIPPKPKKIPIQIPNPEPTLASKPNPEYQLQQTPQREYPYTSHIQQLNTMCRSLYCPHNVYLPIAYEQLVQDINGSAHLVDSDEEDVEENKGKQKDLIFWGNREKYYQYFIT